MVKKLAGRIFKPATLCNAQSTFDVDLDDVDNFKDRRSIFVGGLTRMTLNRLLNQGDISDAQYNKFHDAVHFYFKESLDYIKTKFPIKDDTICNSVWIDVTRRSDVSWENVEHFVDKFQSVRSLEGINEDQLHDEFVDYQTLSSNDFPSEAFEEAKVVDGVVDGEEVFHYRMDTLWWHLNRMRIPQSSVKRFKLLQKVAEAILVIPHSNVELERLFSIVRKNKTDARSSLKLDGTLSSILAMKSMYPETKTPCHKFQPDESMLRSAKSATVKALNKDK